MFCHFDLSVHFLFSSLFLFFNISCNLKNVFYSIFILQVLLVNSSNYRKSSIDQKRFKRYAKYPYHSDANVLNQTKESSGFPFY